jgi:hypothetical protein
MQNRENYDGLLRFTEVHRVGECVEQTTSHIARDRGEVQRRLADAFKEVIQSVEEPGSLTTRCCG